MAYDVSGSNLTVLRGGLIGTAMLEPSSSAITILPICRAVRMYAKEDGMSENEYTVNGWIGLTWPSLTSLNVRFNRLARVSSFSISLLLHLLLNQRILDLLAIGKVHTVVGTIPIKRLHGQEVPVHDIFLPNLDQMSSIRADSP